MENKSKDESSVKKLLEGYHKFKRRHGALKISDKGIEKFASKINSVSEKKAGTSGIRRKIYNAAREVFDRLPSGLRRPVPVFAGAIFVLLVFALVCSYVFIPQAPVLGNIKGIVKVYSSRRNEWVFARNNQRVWENDIIKTFNGRTDIDLGDIYSMRLKSNSEIKIAKLSRRFKRQAVRFNVAKGKVLAFYNRRAGMEKGGFEIKTEEMLTSVVGTNFMLEVFPKIHRTWLGVLDGVVKVESVVIPEGMDPEKAAMYVKSRYRVAVSRGELPETPELMMENKWFQLKELYSIGKKPQVALLISTGGTRVRELLSVVPLYVSDKVSGRMSKMFEKAAGTYEAALKKGSIKLHHKAIKEFEAIVKDIPDPVYNVHFLLFIGAYYEYIGEHAKSIETFYEVMNEYPESSLSSIALCAIGIIYEERLQDKVSAVKAYRKLILQYPRTPEVEEARAALKRLSE